MDDIDLHKIDDILVYIQNITLEADPETECTQQILNQGKADDIYGCIQEIKDEQITPATITVCDIRQDPVFFTTFGGIPFF